MNVQVLHLSKVLTDDQTDLLKGHFLGIELFPIIITMDTDVYTDTGQLLLKFRKGILSNDKAVQFRTAVGKEANRNTDTRIHASGVHNGGKTNIKSSILGYYDKWRPDQIKQAKLDGIILAPCRECQFNTKYPDKWLKCIPFINEIDNAYKMLCTDKHSLQLAEACKTQYRISDTAFTTLTINLNFRTAGHIDAGDYPDGFGNLVVIEDGEYTGGYFGLPQYGVCVDVRQSDFLAVDVHQLHGNTEIIGTNYKRISVVSYLRTAIISKSSK